MGNDAENTARYFVERKSKLETYIKSLPSKLKEYKTRGHIKILRARRVEGHQEINVLMSK